MMDKHFKTTYYASTYIYLCILYSQDGSGALPGTFWSQHQHANPRQYECPRIDISLLSIVLYALNALVWHTKEAWHPSPKLKVGKILIEPEE